MKPAVAVLALCAILLGAGPPGPDKVDVSDYPEAYRQYYEVFAVRCSKCHSLARPINARLKGEQWKSYIKKMIRRPGSGINEESGKQIYLFLNYYTTRTEATPAVDGGTP